MGPRSDREHEQSRRKSFGSQFERVDSAAHPERLLDYLDRVAAIPVVDKMKRETTQALGLRPGERVLDVGCGTGVDLADMHAAVQPGGVVVGIDSSNHAVEVAASRTAGMNGVSVALGDIYDLAFDASSFDAVRADRILLHLDEPDRALSELARVLAPGGRLAMLEQGGALEGRSDVVDHIIHRTLLEMMWHGDEQRTRIDFFLPVLLAQAGLSNTKIDTWVATSSDIDDADAMLRLREFARQASLERAVDESESNSWLSSLEAAMRAGEVVLRVGFTRVVAYR